MFESQTISMQGTTSTVLYSPWFPRGGDYGIFTLEVTSKCVGAGTATLTARLFHKNTSDAGDGAEVPGSISTLALTGAGRQTVDFKYNVSGFTGFKELVRYQFTLSGVSTTNTSIMTFRMLPIVWYDKVA